MPIDPIDVRILKQLQTNARLSVATIAKDVALTATPCARRIKNLEQAGYIKGYVTLLDQSLLGLPVNAFAEVRLVREGKAEVAEFEAAIHRFPQVMECWAMSGAFDYLLRVVTPDLEGYNQFLRNELLRLGCVDHVQTGFALARVVDRTTLPLKHLASR